jgi:hypothetical protein
LVSKQRELPRIVAGTDLMEALQSIEKAKGEGQQRPSTKEVAGATQPAAATKPTAAAKGKKAAKRSDQGELLLPIAGGAGSKEAGVKQPQKTGARKKAS